MNKQALRLQSGWGRHPERKALLDNEVSALPSPVSVSTGHPDSRADAIWMSVGFFAALFAGLIEGNLQFLPLAMVVGVFGYGLCRLMFRGPVAAEQRSAYLQAFSAAMIAIGIARTMAVFFDDQLQNASDAGSFFDTSAFYLRDTNIDEVKIVINGWGAVWLWSLAYEMTRSFFSEPTPLVGLSVNALALALGGAIIVDAAATLPGALGGGQRTAKRLYVWCFIFWMFASFHLRDVFSVFLSVLTIRIWLWVYVRYSAARLLLAIGASFGIAWVIGSVRSESSSIVAVMAVLGVCGLVSQTKNVLVLIVALIGLLGMAAFYYFVFAPLSGVAQTIAFYQEGYQFGMADNSLGNAIIVSRTGPLRAVLGFIYVHIVPVPAWSGFFLLSPYHWFKSLQVVYMAYLLPAAITGSIALFGRGAGQRSYLFFLGAVYIVITLAVALSSLESRHSAQVLPCAILLAAVPHDRHKCGRLRSLFIAGLGLVHLFWVFLKIIQT